MFISFQDLGKTLEFTGKNNQALRRFIVSVLGDSVIVRGGAELTEQQQDALLKARDEMMTHNLTYDQVRERFYIEPAEQSRAEQQARNVQQESGGSVQDVAAQMVYHSMVKPLMQSVGQSLPDMMLYALGEYLTENPDEFRENCIAKTEEVKASYTPQGGGDFFKRVVLPAILPPEDKSLPPGQSQPLLIEAREI